MVPPHLPDSRRSSVQPKLTSFFSLPSTDDTSMVTSNTDTLEHPSSTDSNITQAAAESSITSALFNVNSSCRVLINSTESSSSSNTDVTCSRHRVSATNSASAYRTGAGILSHILNDDHDTLSDSNSSSDSDNDCDNDNDENDDEAQGTDTFTDDDNDDNDRLPPRKRMRFSKKKKNPDTFHPSWEKSFKWLELSENRKVAYCSLCRKYKQKNPFADYKKGSTNRKRSALRTHNNSAQHKHAETLDQMSKQMSVSPNNAYVRKAATVDKYLEVLVDCAFFVAKRGRPLTDFSDHVRLQLRRLDSSFRHSRFTQYHNFDGARGLIESIHYVEYKNFRSKLKASPFITLILDETTDISVFKQLLVYILFLDNETPTVKYSRLLQLDACDADSIMRKIQEHLNHLGVDMKRVIGLGTDGASVMTGRHNGVAVQMQRMNPFLLFNHCCAHRLALASKDAAGAVPFTKTVETLFQDMYAFYSKSYIHLENLEFWQEFETDGSLQILKVVKTRWLSMALVAKRFWNIISPLGQSLNELSSNDPSGIAANLLNRLRQYRFVGFLAFLNDILGELALLQTSVSDFNITRVSQAINSTIQIINRWYLVPGGNYSPSFREFLEEVSESENANPIAPAFRSITLTILPQDHENLIRDISLYCRKVIGYLQQRFHELPIISAFSIFVPRSFPFFDTGFAEYGIQNLKILCDWFGRDKDVNGVLHRRLIDRYQVKEEWDKLKNFVLDHACFRDYDLRTFWKRIWTLDDPDLIRYERFPNLSILARIGMLLPTSSVDAERGFSAMNRLKNKLRNRMSNDRLDSLMFIHLNGPSIDDFDGLPAIEHWKATKDRRTGGRS